MADSNSKPTIVPARTPATSEKRPAGEETLGTIDNTADGAGTQQREPKPEDYPRSAKVTPPSEQVNPRSASSVGDIINPGDTNSATDALTEAADAHAENLDKSADAAERIAEARKTIAELGGG